MADLRLLETNYPKDSRTAFEDLCTLLFCTELSLSHGVNRRVNQRGIESDPVRIDDMVYAYQAKYFDATTRLGDRKKDLVKSIKAARMEGVTDLLLYVNKDLPDKNADGTETKLVRDLETAAQGATGEPEVKLHWWSRSKIETTLDMGRYDHIRSGFLGSGGESRLAAYYDYVCGQFRDDNGSELYGEIPLRECYIEPTIMDERARLRDVTGFIESWVDGDDYIAVICGEPGHGKTSLCRKAVHDFRTGGWLAGKVPNVLCFSLNPAKTGALADGEIDLYALLSWGDNRRSAKHRIDEEDCRGALVFLDGFDELLEWRPGFDLWSFIRDHVAGFQMDTGAHVVITSRTMAVGTAPSATAIIDSAGRSLPVPVIMMQPVSREHQLAWIERCVDYFRRLAADDSGAVGADDSTEASRASTELEDYLPRYRRLHEDGTLQAILGVPIIFRMVVAARYVPRGGESIVQIYDELFRITWERHKNHVEGQSMEGAKARLSRHALRVYLDEEDTAVVEDVLKSPWSFSFYTTHGERSRVGFLHRSFYQYFLAHEIVDWFRRYAKDGNTDALRASLACLARRQLDKTTLGYIRDIHGVNPEKDAMDAAFDKAYEILSETDGFLPISDSDGTGASHVKAIAPSERARNVFCNVVSACSVCGVELTSDRLVSSYPLRHYDMSGCNLIGARLSTVNLKDARLMGADLSEADLSRANLSAANLERACLDEAHLEEACLDGAHLVNAIFVGAHLENADLSGANLRMAVFLRADLKRAKLREANLVHADLAMADLSGADITNAHLAEASCFGTDFTGTIGMAIGMDNITVDFNSI